MSVIDLVLLGLVYEQPQSAYDMQKNIELTGLSRWVKISMPSVYKKVLLLEQQGHLSSCAVRQGKMPEKIVYSITDSGKSYFLELMQVTARSSVNVLLEFNAVASNLGKLPQQQALALIGDISGSILSSESEMQESLLECRQEIISNIIEQQIQVLHTLYKWTDSFAKVFR